MPEKDREISKASLSQVKRAPQTSSKTPNMEQLVTKSTDELIRLLVSPDMNIPVNAPIRQLIIKILQERKGNAFVQTLLGGKTAGGK